MKKGAFDAWRGEEGGPHPFRAERLAIGALALFASLTMTAVGRAAPARQEAEVGERAASTVAVRPAGEALALFVRSSAALIAEAAGRADGPSFEIVIDDDVETPVARFESGARAHVSAGLLRSLAGLDEWAALLAHLEAVHELEYGPRAGRKRFRVRTAPPADSLFRSGSTDLNDRIARRSNESAIETLNRRRLTMLSEEERAERAVRIDAAALEILRAGRIGGMALRRLYSRLQEAGGGMIEDAGPEGRRLAARHLAWLAHLPLADRPLPDEWRALSPLFVRARAAFAAHSSEADRQGGRP